jgi:probable rRNA maturation factor
VISIEVNNQQPHQCVDIQQLHNAARAVLQGEGISVATISIAVVDDATIHSLNCRYLKHDYPTDVLSFVLDDAAAGLDGEVIVSAETAARQCGHYGWSAQDELVLYTVHGVLHLVGYDDQRPQQAEQMRARERLYLNQLGSVPAECASQGDA